MVSTLLLAFVALVVVGAVGLSVRRVRQPKALMWQFGAFTNTRAGIKQNDNWRDEPDIVEFTDFKYWVRIRPNPGVNLPLVGYWSKAKGRKGP